MSIYALNRAGNLKRRLTFCSRFRFGEYIPQQRLHKRSKNGLGQFTNTFKMHDKILKIT